MRNLGQTKCKWCRKWHHACRASGCLSQECKYELQEYIRDNGAHWWAKLRKEWAQGSIVLRELRNTVGPTELSNVKGVQPATWIGKREVEKKKNIFGNLS